MMCGELLVRRDFNACHYPNLCTILVREGGRRHKAWGENPRTASEGIIKPTTWATDR